MKLERHAKILELIANERIETQEDLARRLNECGFEVTQATVSRDIRQLRLTKVSLKDGKSYYAVLNNIDTQKADKYIRVLKEGFLSMDMAMNLLVIKTVEGMAMAVATALDNMHWDEIVGCIAGDDTIMCAIRNIDDTLRVMNKIQNIIRE